MRFLDCTHRGSSTIIPVPRYPGTINLDPPPPPPGGVWVKLSERKIAIPENFRLQRPQNRVFGVFEATKFPPAADQKSCVVCFQTPNFLACGGHPTNLVFKHFFTGVGTRFCYLAAARMQFQVFSRVQERASAIHKNILTAAQTQFLAFHECRNALLLFAKMI